MTNATFAIRINVRKHHIPHRSKLMFAGLPWTAWLLLILSVGLGLSMVLVFYVTQRRRGTSDPAERDKNG